MALYHFSAKVLSRSHRNTVRAVAYRAGCMLEDPQTAEVFNYRDKQVQHVELLLPKDAPAWAVECQKLMAVDRQNGVQAFVDRIEAAENRKDSQVWREFEFALHRELTNEQNIALAREFVQDQLCGRGMAAQLNFHFDVDEETGEEKPHCHVVATTRRLEETGMGAKERDWNKKELLHELRVQWQDYSNFHLKLNGADVQIDHRCNKERGIEMEPQPKRGKGIQEFERKEQSKSIQNQNSPIKDKAKEFQAVQLRNLYRIVRNPEFVLDIATKYHATFMWADVQKILHRYVNDIALFQRLEARLLSSQELIVLRTEEKDGKAIYTTRDMLKAERSLVERAETLDKAKTHGVAEQGIVKGIQHANEALNAHGGLSQDQIKAIYHLVDVGQIKCMVGIAGAGKTTALGVCQDIWKEAGYGVYGLAPTGKAVQNLEDSGISSTTLHKFLLSYEQGRCQYNAGSVLVLDEAGMVDIPRFEKLMSAVKQLGVKLIVVGDGAQLQPVEAGPAFRLVTERIGKSELNTVIRQKSEWQKQATVLFGKQQTQDAIQEYADRGYVHIVEEKLPDLKDLQAVNDHEGIIKLYETTARVSALMYREMIKDVHKDSNFTIRQHQYYEKYIGFREIEKDSASHILGHSEDCRPILEARGIDPFKMALLFVNRSNEKSVQQENATRLLTKCGLASLIGIEKTRGQGADVREAAKDALIASWHEAFKENPDKTSLMLAFSNKDVKDLNESSRVLLKESNHISKKDVTFTIKKEIEDDFGRKCVYRESKGFSKGDKVVFTRNNAGLGIKNGSLGSIIELDKQKLQVKLDHGKEVTFAPNLNPYFDHGWAVTIHKSQGTTVDQTFLLVSYEMSQNLAYVGMTRHREDVHVFGSSLDFWRPEKLPEVLSKSGEKLSAADYLDADSLNKLMQEDDHLITKIFTRLSDELEAMGAVSKKAFWKMADHFLGLSRESEIRVSLEHLSQVTEREEVRAEKLFQEKGSPNEGEMAVLPKELNDQINFLISIPEKKMPVMESRAVISSLESRNAEMAREHSFRRPHSLIKVEDVENVLKQNMASFADDIFASIGIRYDPASSSATERRYGKNGHISVNLKSGAWIDYKDPDMAGGPLHLLTKIKGLSYKEAVEYGVSRAGISLETGELPSSYRPPQLAQEERNKEREQEQEAEHKTRIEKAQALWQKGLPLKGTLAERYLREHRKIEGDLPNDLRYLPSFKDRSLADTVPCLMSAARSSKTDEITAVQLTFLNPETAGKADLPVAKKTYGILKGSAVIIQEDPNNKSPDTVYVAEGLETALSLKEAGLKGRIMASLGLSNIKRFVPNSPSTRLIICADHDAPDSPATRSVDKSVAELQAKGYSVTIIKPEKLGDDFNDVLKTQGSKKIKEFIERTETKTTNIQDKGTANISLRAKYELNRIPEIQKDLMEEGETNGFHAFQMAERQASIEGRLYFEVLGHGKPEPLHLSFTARQELHKNQDQLPRLTKDLQAQHVLSGRAASYCAESIMRYKETHGENPSAGQIANMVQISRELKHKDYSHIAQTHDPVEIDFLRRKEGDLLLSHSLPHDISGELMHAQTQARRSLEMITARLEKEQHHMNQRDLSL